MPPRYLILFIFSMLHASKIFYLIYISNTWCFQGLYFIYISNTWCFQVLYFIFILNTWSFQDLTWCWCCLQRSPMVSDPDKTFSIKITQKEIEIILTFSFDCQLAPRGSLPCSCYPFLDKHLIPRFPHVYPFKVWYFYLLSQFFCRKFKKNCGNPIRTYWIVYWQRGSDIISPYPGSPSWSRKTQFLSNFAQARNEPAQKK